MHATDGADETFLATAARFWHPVENGAWVAGLAKGGTEEAYRRPDMYRAICDEP